VINLRIEAGRLILSIGALMVVEGCGAGRPGQRVEKSPAMIAGNVGGAGERCPARCCTSSHRWGGEVAGEHVRSW
jgi:hypothetical protein